MTHFWRLCIVEAFDLLRDLEVIQLGDAAELVVVVGEMDSSGAWMAKNKMNVLSILDCPLVENFRISGIRFKVKVRSKSLNNLQI